MGSSLERYGLVNSQPKGNVPSPSAILGKYGLGTSSLSQPVDITPLDEEKDDSIWGGIGRFTRFIHDLPMQIASSVQEKAGPNSSAMERFGLLGSNIIDRAAQVTTKTFSNLQKTMTDWDQYAYETSVPNIAKDAYNIITTPIRQILTTDITEQLKTMPAALGEQFVNKPIEALTGYRNEGGQAVPITVDEQASAMQNFVGTAATFLITHKVSSAMTPTVNAANVAKLAKGSTLGRLGKIALDETVAGSLGSIAGGTIANLGQDDLAVKVAEQAIIGLPLAYAMGAFVRFPLESYSIRSALTDFNAQQKATVAQLNGLVDLRSNLDDTMGNTLSKLESFATSDDLIKAAIKSKLVTNDGLSATGLSLEYVQELMDTYGPTAQLDKFSIKTPERINSYNPVYTYQGVGYRVNWETPFDKVAYASLAKKPPAYVAAAIGELVDQGYKIEDIKAHGRYLRDTLKSKIKASDIKLPDQPTIDAIEQTVATKGLDIINRTLDNSMVQDFRGQQWLRAGDTFTNGQVSYPANSLELQKTLGRSIKDIPSNAPYVDMKGVGTNNNYGREALPFYAYHSLANDKTFISGAQLTEKAANHFEQTGFLPDQVLQFNGSNYKFIRPAAAGRVVIENINTGTYRVIPYESLSELGSISLETKNIVGKNSQGKLYAEINYDNLSNKIYEDIVTTYNIKDPNLGQSFDNLLYATLDKYNVNPKDYLTVGSSVYSRLSKDIIKLMPLEEQNVLQPLRNDFSRMEETRTNNRMMVINTMLQRNGWYLDAEGAGVYKVKDRATGAKIFEKGFDNYDSILDAISKTKQSREFLDLDGGDINKAANLGGMVTDYSSNINAANVGFFGDIGNVKSALAPTGNLFAEFDGVKPAQTNFFKAWQTTQDANRARKTFIATKFKPATDIYNQMVSLRKGMNDMQLQQVSDAVEAMTPQETIQKFLVSRQMNQQEIQLAQSMASSADIDKIKDVLYETRTLSEGGGVGTPEYKAALVQYIKDKKIPAPIAKLAGQFADLVSSSTKENFSPAGVLTLAEKLQNPAQAISRAEYMKKNVFTPDQIKMVGLSDAFYKTASTAGGLNENSHFGVYLPHVKNSARLGIGNAVFDDKFFGELNRVGITPDGLLLRDPVQLAYRYGLGVANKASGFSDTMIQANKLMDESRAKLVSQLPEEATGLNNINNGINHAWEKYTRQLSGKPEGMEQLTNGVITLTGKLGFDKAQTAVILADLATQSLKPSLGLRDWVSGLGFTFSYKGLKFAKDAFFSKIDEAMIARLEDEGVIPRDSAMEMHAPGSTQNFFGPDSFGRKMVNASFSTTLQPMVYKKMLAGIYNATEKQAIPLLNKLQQGDITKEAAYSAMDIDVLQPGAQKYFDDLVTEGKTLDAIRFLGIWNGKRLVNHFGSANSPLAMSTTPGRLFGQYASWGLNSYNTMKNEVFVRGSLSTRLQKATRLALFNGAIGVAGMAVGYDMMTWYTNPISMAVAGGGPVISSARDLATASTTLMSGDPQTREYGQRTLQKIIPFTGGADEIGNVLVPYSFALENLVKGFQLFYDGHPLLGAGQAIGMKAIP